MLEENLTTEQNEPNTSINEKLTPKEMIERFAKIQGMSFEEAEQLIGADNEVDILANIAKFTTEKVKNSQVQLNRAQRRALQKRYGKKAVENMTPQTQQQLITETATKLSKIDLIQKLRKLNAEKAKENNNGETTNKTN